MSDMQLLINSMSAQDRRLGKLERQELTVLWNNIVSDHLLLRNLRGYWPFTSVDENRNVYDLSGQGRTLTNQGSTPINSELAYELLTYADFTPGSAQYFSRTDEAGLDITGALTMGGWFRLTALSPGADTAMMSKYDSAGNDRSYMLYFLNASNQFRFIISNNGTATTNITFSVSPAASAWYHVCCRYMPGTELTMFVNGVKEINFSSIPASIHNSAAALMIGNNVANQYFDGQIAHCFLCGDALEDIFIQKLFSDSRSLFRV